MKKTINELSTPIDRASKLLFKMYPHILIDLAFPDQKVELINVEENVEINLPTRPLDIVMTIRCLEPDGEWREKILHVEHYAHYKPTVPVTLFMYSAEQRSLLLSLVALLAGRYFDKAYLHQLFRKEVEMLRTNTFFDDWWLEAEQKGEKRGEKIGEKKGFKKGTVATLREVILKLVESRFHTLSYFFVSSVNRLEKTDLEQLLDLAFSAATLQEIESAVAKMLQSAESEQTDEEND